MAYTPTFTKPYTDGWQNLPEETTPITREILDSYDTAIESAEEQLQRTTEIFDNEKSRVAIGMSNKTSGWGYRSGVFGSNNTVEANDVLVQGYGNTVSNSGSSYSAVFGTNNEVSASACIVSGNQNTVSGLYGATVGSGNENTSDYSNLFGMYLKSMENSYDAHLVCGYYNDPSEYIEYGKQIVFGVGAGMESVRQNVLLLDEDGNLKIKGKLISGSSSGNKTVLFDSVSAMQSTLNYANNTQYAVGDTLRSYKTNTTASDDAFMDFYIVSVESTSVSNSDSPVTAVRKSTNGTAQFGYYVIAPVRAINNQIKCYDCAGVVSLCNESAALEIGQILMTIPSDPKFFIWSRNTSKVEYTYTTKADFLNDFANSSGMLTVGYYQLMMLVPMANYNYPGLILPNPPNFILDFATGTMSLRPAGTGNLGGVKPDGESTEVSADGVLSVRLTDSVTGTVYKLAVENGELKIVAV